MRTHVYQPFLVYELVLGLSSNDDQHCVNYTLQMCQLSHILSAILCKASIRRKTRQRCHEHQNTLLFSVVHLLAN